MGTAALIRRCITAKQAGQPLAGCVVCSGWGPCEGSCWLTCGLVRGFMDSCPSNSLPLMESWRQALH